MQLELIDIFSDFARVESIWTALSEQSECSYFLSWGWIENWISSLPRNMPVKLAVLTDGSEVISAFFLGRAKMANQKVFRSKAYLLNQTGKWAFDRLYIEQNAILCRTGSSCTLQQILELLPGDWEELYLNALDPASFPGNDLEGVAKPNRMMIANVLPCPYVDLQSVRDKGGDYPAVLGSSIRSQIRRAYRLYSEQGPVTCEVAKDRQSALEIHAELMQLHQASWQLRNQTGAFDTEYSKDFHRRLIENRIASGEIQLVRVRCGDTTIGCVYNFVYRGTVYFYQSGLTIATDNRFKPGYVCHAEAIKVNAANGLAIYDFLAGFDEYKQRLATNQRQMIWARVQKPLLKFRVERVLRKAALEGLARYRQWKRGKGGTRTLPAESTV